MSGILTSINTRSGGSAFAFASPSSPFPAVMTSNPRRPRRRVSNARLSGSSSTMRILGIRGLRLRRGGRLRLDSQVLLEPALQPGQQVRFRAAVPVDDLLHTAIQPASFFRREIL